MEQHSLMNSNDSPSDVETHDMESLAISKKHNYIGDFNRLIANLQSENEAEFLQGIESFAKNNSDQLPGLFQTTDTNGSLLTLACEKGLVQAVQALLRLGANIDAVIHTRRGLWNAVEVTCQFGNWEVLEILLKSPKLDLSKSRSILSSVVRNIDEKETPKCNYKKCFQLLLDHKDIDVNQLNAYGFSPLHYAVRFNNSDAIVELMKHGAYIGQKNKFNRYAISNIKPDLLKRHFDSCITTNNLRIGDDHFEIQFDYSSLVPVPTRKQNDKKSTAEHEMSSDCCPNEMTAIEYMSESNKHRHLLNHPLIRSFLFLKWNQFAFVFYMNFILSLLFALSTASFIFFCYLDGRKNVGIRYTILQIVTFLLTFYMIVREMSQFALSPLAFLRRAVNYMELVMIILVLIVLFDPDKENRPIFAASLLVLVGIEVFHLAGSLPFGSFSIHYVMLKKLISSCVKTFSHYVIPIMIFSLAFYILVRGNPQLITEAGKLPKEFKEIPGEFKSFAKLISMMIATTSGVGVTLLSCFFFISFITPTVFLNLLNGLAVIDIKNIKSEAELTNLIHRCEVLSRYEKTLLDNQHWFSVPILKNCFSHDLTSVFKKLGSTYRIGVKTNVNNQISIPNDDSDKKPMLCKSCFSYFGRCSQMDDKIVNLANEVLEDMHSNQNKDVKSDLLRDEIQELKASIELIKNQLNAVDQKLNGLVK